MRLALGIPAYKGTIAAGHAQMWLQLGMRLHASREVFKAVHMIQMDVCGVDRARNFILAHAMSLGCDWLLMIDSDTWVDPKGIIEMLFDGASRGAAIIGAPVYRRVDEEQRLNVIRDGHTLTTSNIGNKIIEIDGIGGAVMAINLHKVNDAEFKFTSMMSEDIDFCRQLKDAGGKIFCDPRVKTLHLKSDVMIYEPTY